MKSFLRHEVLNIFTIFTCYLEKKELSRQEKNHMLELIQLASFLVGQENILLGEKPKFLWEDVGLKEFLEYVLLCHEEEGKTVKVETVFPRNAVLVRVDRHYVGEAIGRIVSTLLSLPISFLLLRCSARGVIQIEHDAPDTTSLIPQSPTTYVRSKNISAASLAYHLAAHLLKLSGSTVQYSKNRITIPLIPSTSMSKKL